MAAKAENTQDKTIIIGSRGSELALWQANFVKAELEKHGAIVKIDVIKTVGDKVQNLSFDKLEGKGFFTKEIEEALQKREIDLAVHSHKDLPTESPAGLIVAAVSDREDPSELLLINKEAVDLKQKYSFKKNALVGTSSARRKSQLHAFRGDAVVEDLRGNVPTRIQKLRDKKYDVIMIAAAGVERLQLDVSEFHCEKLDPREFVPAPAQGVLALQIREDDKQMFDLLQKLNNPSVAARIAIERKVLNLFDGGCQLPLGVYCEQDTDEDEEHVFKVWSAKADSFSDVPVFLYTENKKTEGLAEKIVSKIERVKAGSVFITRNLHPNSLFSKVLTRKGYEVNGQTLIEFKRIEMKSLPQTDWIFFSSKHAVEHFFEQKPELKEQKIGAVGKGTSDAIRKYGKRADFIGYSTDTKMTGKQFASQVKNGTVLFPQAKESLKSIQKQFTNPSQVIDLSVYQTILHDEVPVPQADIMVFTSPSNVDAFFKKNKLASSQRIVAMGGATEHELSKHGIKKCVLPITFDDLGLLQAVFEQSIIAKPI
jgi:hydroxymethylbilane synthase